MATATNLSVVSPGRDPGRQVPPALTAPPNVKTRCTAPLAITGPVVPAVFDGLETWPNLDEALRKRSLRLLREVGIQDWKLRGGTLDSGGEPTLGSPSSEALETLSEVLKKRGRFRYRDGAGVSWAARVGETAEHWRGLAIGCTGEVGLLVRAKRARLLKHVDQSLDSIKRLARTTKATVLARARLSYLRRWLVGLNTAAMLVESLYITARVSPRMKIDPESLAQDVWGENRCSWPDDWRAAVFEALAMLGSIELQVVQFEKTGWHPESLSRQPAGLGVGWVDSEILEIRWSPLFIDFLGEWLRPGKPLAKYLDSRPVRC